MYTPVSLIQLDNARKDVKSLEEVINGDDESNVTTRTGESYPTLSKALKTLFENGMFGVTPFETKSLMTASALDNGSYATVTNDTAENSGLYLKKSGVWAKVTYDVDERQSEYTDVAAAATLASSKTYADDNFIPRDLNPNNKLSFAIVDEDRNLTDIQLNLSLIHI